MIHVTCRLTAKNRDSSGTLRSVTEYGLPLPFYDMRSALLWVLRNGPTRDDVTEKK